MIYSDHTPISTEIIVKPSCSSNFLLRCSEGTLSDDHLDINKRKPPAVVFSKVDWVSAISAFEEKAVEISEAL